MDKLAIDKVCASPVHVGSGQVKCAHGLLPVPAPATANILNGVPIYGGAIKGELCTPTGAALLKHFADRFGELPVMKTEAIGYGILRISFICLPYFICGMMEVSTGALRGLGTSLLPMAVSVLGVCGIRLLWIATIFQMPQFHTTDCLYISYGVSWTATFIAQFAAFWLVYNKQKRKAESL
jgi:Na+-driven multidrug efflux pump